jgi:hypothetical protein
MIQNMHGMTSNVIAGENRSLKSAAEIRKFALAASEAVNVPVACPIER